MPKTTAARNAVLDAILRNVSLAAGATMYMSLHSADPGATGASNELSGSNYARTAITFGSAAASGAIENTAAVTFPTPSANWTAATHFGIWSAASGGTCYYTGTLAAAVTGQSGVPVSFPIGAVDVTET